MKIVSVTDLGEQKGTFGHLVPGDVFHDGDFIPMLKTDGDSYNAVIIQNGSEAKYLDNQMVFPMKVELRVEGKVSLS